MDKNYWDDFYDGHSDDGDIKNASTFAKFCQTKFLQNTAKNIVELGCGNARDAYYMTKRGHTVYAIDQAIDDKVKQKRKHENLHLIEEDFVYNDYDFKSSIDVFYSRFTIHSIEVKDEQHLLPNVYKTLKEGGLFCIEVRTTKDPKFGKGKHRGGNTYFFDNHNRRFIDSDEFVKTAIGLGFKLKYFTEENNLSVRGDDNPVLMRIVLEK
jgi:SAM-dependent methyltransferase